MKDEGMTLKIDLDQKVKDAFAGLTKALGSFRPHMSPEEIETAGRLLSRRKSLKDRIEQLRGASNRIRAGEVMGTLHGVIIPSSATEEVAAVVERHILIDLNSIERQLADLGVAL